MSTQYCLPAERFSSDALQLWSFPSRAHGFTERRAAMRQPFFAPVALLPLHDRRRRFTAFSREVSATGIGLLHNMPLKRGDIYEVTLRPHAELRKYAEVIWCQAVGAGWYCSGCRFLQKRGLSE